LTLQVPYYSYSDIGEKVDAFFAQYYPSREIPIPIEEIIELKLQLHIYPFPRLYIDHRQNGFLSADRTTINVDQVQYDQYIDKFRYTLAHELGHFILHESCYKNQSFSSPIDYVSWLISVDREAIGWFETHADWFAEQILVPTEPLEAICREVIAKHKKTFSALKVVPDTIWSYISNEISGYFDVNPPVVECRLRRSALTKKIHILDA